MTSRELAEQIWRDAIEPAHTVVYEETETLDPEDHEAMLQVMEGLLERGAGMNPDVALVQLRAANEQRGAQLLTPQEKRHKSREEETHLIRSVRERFLGFALKHEQAGCKESPAGEVCWTNRTNSLAFLAHTLGITPAMLEEVSKHLKIYDDNHDMAHDHNGGQSGP